jgi:hypothetical protein
MRNFLGGDHSDIDDEDSLPYQLAPQLSGQVGREVRTLNKSLPKPQKRADHMNNGPGWEGSD